MKNSIRFFGIIALVVVIGFSTVGCATLAGQPAQPSSPQIIGVNWSQYTNIPSKNYIVVGTIILRNVTHASVLADLMEAAVEKGGHNIKNVRLTVSADGRTISSATAMAIKYTDETIVEVGRNVTAVITPQPIGDGTGESRRPRWMTPVIATAGVGLGFLAGFLFAFAL